MEPNDMNPSPSCFGYRGVGSTAEGSLPLRNPFTSASALLHDRARHKDDLNPRNRKRKRDSTEVPLDLSVSASCSSYVPSFSPASDVRLESSNVPPTRPRVHSSSKRKSKFFSSPQKNTLFNHSFTRTCQPNKQIEPDHEKDVELICVVKKRAKLFKTSTPHFGNAVMPEGGQPWGMVTPGIARCDTKDQEADDQLGATGGDSYGLLGLNESEDFLSDSDPGEDQPGTKATPGLMDMPDAILEDIFARLPLPYLVSDVYFVCNKFRDIVGRPEFLYWRKKYQSLKDGERKTVNFINDRFHGLEMDDIRNVLPNIPKCIHGFRRIKSEDHKEMLKCLEHHSKYEWAIIFIKEIVLPGFLDSDVFDKYMDPWLIVGALVALSDSVADISRILELLSRSPCILKELLEALYCLAAYLFAVTTYHKALYGLHYYVFYALYLFENEWQAKVTNVLSAFYAKGQQNILQYCEGESKIRLTLEQSRIINHELHSDQVVKVVAFAGTGKTSTLVQFAKMRQGLKFLLIVYNKSAQTHASRMFPTNVECRTMSSIAYSEGRGNKFKKKLTTKLRPLDILPFIRTKTIAMNCNTYTRHILTAIEKFVASADPGLTLTHVQASPSKANEEPLTNKIAVCALKEARKIWKKMCDPDDLDVKATHDTYLKLYQLTSPVLKGYSCIMIDEAQDYTPAMLDIILSQRSPKIFVGDPHQQIYSFRGAINALDAVPSTHTYYLTQSFRFGPQIAYVAHCALAILKNVTDKTLVGGKQNSEIMGHHEGQLAIIARCNSTLFMEAVRIFCKDQRLPHEPRFVRAAFVGGLESYNFDQLLSIYNLMRGRVHIKDKFIAHFRSFSLLRAYADRAGDQELMGKIKLVLQYVAEIPKYVQTLRRKCKYSLKDANLVFTTAHKAKGMEFDTVSLTDDYPLGSNGVSSLCITRDILTKPASESMERTAEYNILYVALTRAKKCLIVSETLNVVLRTCQEYFEVPVLMDWTRTQEICLQCSNPVIDSNPKSFVLFKKPVRQMKKKDYISGLVCRVCAGAQDMVDTTTGFFLKDKNKHAYSKITGADPKDKQESAFDVLNFLFNQEPVL